MSKHLIANTKLLLFNPDLADSSLEYELAKATEKYPLSRILLNTEMAAQYLCFSACTLAAWRSGKRHRLLYQKKGKIIYYRLSDLNAFIAAHASKPLENPHLCQPLINRKRAATEVNSTLGTLEVWNSTGTKELVYIKIGRAVRYRPYDLMAFNLARLRIRKSE
ncbi:helix-turn-helix domain-containing protein [Emticicia sp. BO119]|uniref:helix-turn-helix domain-containing protein n=1 Tax=Emticicia sp. BO119 TaxID=2757768 RepID=UPI001E6035BA|nr:helix-turn-helix domain-containing protein [Emticicia sp. BO119]